MGRRDLACSALAVAFLVQAVVGVTVVFGYGGALWAWHRTRVAEALWGTSDVPELALPLMHQLGAMLGGTMAAWGVAMAWITHVPLRRGERWAGAAIVTSVLAWFPFDTGMSVAHGAWVNVTFNVVAVAMIAIPLAVMRGAPAASR